jgi:hypothetical protein
MEVVVDNH